MSDPAQTPPTRRSQRSAIALLVLIAGLAGYCRDALRDDHAADAVASGAFWDSVAADGAPLTIRRSGHLRIPSKATVHFTEPESATRRYQSIGLVAQRETSGTLLEIRFRETEAGYHTVRISPATLSGILLAYKPNDGPLAILQQRHDLATGGEVFRDLDIEIAIDDDNGVVELLIGGESLLRSDQLRGRDGTASLSVRGGSVRLRSLRLRGTEVDGTARTPFAWQDDFGGIGERSPTRRVLEAGGTALLMALLATSLLWLLCLGRPTLAEVARAAALWLLPLATWGAVGLWRPLPTSYPVWIVLLLLGTLTLLPALFVLRHRLTPDDSGAQRAGTSLLPLCIAVLGLGSFAAGATAYWARYHAGSMLRQRQAAELTVGAPIAIAGPRDLTLADALPLPTVCGDLDFAVDLRLDPGAIAQLRLHAPMPKSVEGVSLFLSNDPRFASGFYQETRADFRRISADAGVVPADTPLHIEVSARGQRLTAMVDGRPFTAADDDTFAWGSGALLAAAGACRITDLRLTPLATGHDGFAVLRGRVSAAAAPVSFAIALAVLSTLLLGLPFCRSLALYATALLPLAVLFVRRMPTGADDRIALAFVLLITALLLLLAPMVHSQKLRLWQLALLVLLLGYCGATTYQAAIARPWPPDAAAFNRLDITAWQGDRQYEDLVHLTHPLLRRSNVYLAEHRLRERQHTLRPADQVTRIAVIGTSSAYGYTARTPYGHRVEDKLDQLGLRTEVLVGAIQGSTGSRLYYFLRNVIAKFEPQIVVLSLYYNDVTALAQFDEREYLRTILAPGFERGPVFDLTTRAQIAAGRRAYSQFSLLSAEQIPPTLRDGPDSPPQRFARVLSDFAALCREFHMTLILMKEPSVAMANGSERLLKAEFHTVIDDVGKREGLTVFDPGPELLQRGGASLFLDPVHPLDAGHEEIAELLTPVLTQAIKARGGQ